MNIRPALWSEGKRVASKVIKMENKWQWESAQVSNDSDIAELDMTSQYSTTKTDVMQKKLYIGSCY